MAMPDRVTLTAQVRMQLRQAILSGAVIAGERLDESQLSRLLKVSRASIREALHQLAGEGLLVYRPNRGMFVRDYDLKAATDLFATRLLIEPWTARLSAKRATPTAIENLHQLLRSMAIGVADRDWLATMVADAQLHLAIAEASGNHSLFRVVRSLSGETQLLVAKSGPTIYDSHEELLLDHEELVEAIETADAEGAERISRNHIDSAASRFLGKAWLADRKLFGP